MIPSQMLRELGAATRTFRTVRRALLWYFDYQEGRYVVLSPSLEVGHNPRSKEELDRDLATWATVFGCLRDVKHAFRLVDWHRAYVPQQQLSAGWGYPNVFTMRWDMRRIEDRLRDRMDSRGLLEGN